MTQGQERAVVQTGPRTIADPSEEAHLTRQLIVRNASDAQFRLLMGICDRYGFDPLLKHVLIVSNNIYVTRDGLLHLAHASKQFDGIAVEMTQTRQGEWVATCTVHRKDMAHPIVYSAFESEHKPDPVPRGSAWEKYPRAMLQKCSEVMALRRAFDVSLGAVEEIGYDGTTGRTQHGETRFVETEAREVAPRPAPPYDADAAELALAEHDAPALFTDAEFQAVMRQLEVKAADGEATAAITTWLNGERGRMADGQYRLLANLWRSIKAARKAGEAWPHPDAAADAVEEGQSAALARSIRVEGDGWETVGGTATPVEVTPLGSADARATERQVKFIFAIGREAQLDKAAVEEQSDFLYQCPVEQLNRKQAAELIEALQKRRGELAFADGQPAGHAG